MSRPDTASVAARLYDRFLAPLVLGGDVVPGPAIGARAALSLEHGLAATDPDMRSRVDLARVRVARTLFPLDTVTGPDVHEWALAAALHDTVHALHPELDGILYRSVPGKLFDYAEHALSRVAPARSLFDLLSRHTLFSRMFDVARTDSVVSWWTESRTFRGREPPPRLLAWPGVRKVRVRETTLALTEVADARGVARATRFAAVIARFLDKVPLTDLATVTRRAPHFEWTGGVLGLFTTPRSRSIALRALDHGARDAVDGALGRATRGPVKAEAWDIVGRVLDVLGERALALAVAESPSLVPAQGDPSDAAFAGALGARVALTRLPLLAVSPAEKARVERRLSPLVVGERGGEANALVARFGDDYFLAVLGKAAGSVGGSSTSSEA